MNDTLRCALVVDDVPEVRLSVGNLLRRDGFQVVEAADGLQAVTLARTFSPALIVLDLSLPKLDGVEVCRQVRQFSDAYVLMLTGRDQEVDVIVGLSAGADGYLTKPFSPAELTARVRALIRRPLPVTTPADGSTVPAGLIGHPGSAGVADTRPRRFGALTLDPLSRDVHVDGVEVPLTRTEFDLLETLTSNPRMTFRRSLLLQRVWGENYFGDDHVVDVHMANLRRKLKDNSAQPRFVRTVRGVGYRMVAS